MPTTAYDAAPVAAVSLDIWGTLLGSDPAFKPARNAMLRDRFAPDLPADGFDAAMREADRDVDEECVRHGVDVGFAGRVEATLRALGRPGVTVANAEAELLAGQERLALAHPPRALHPRLPHAVAGLTVPAVLTSNTGMLPGALMRRLLAAAGFGMLSAVFSDEVGVAKPHPVIFAEAVARLGVPAAQVLHIGDNPDADVAGAHGAGLGAVLVRPDGESTLDVLERL